jgi:hypothetical protein
MIPRNPERGFIQHSHGLGTSTYSRFTPMLAVVDPIVIFIAAIDTSHAQSSPEESQIE